MRSVSKPAFAELDKIRTTQKFDGCSLLLITYHAICAISWSCEGIGVSSAAMVGNGGPPSEIREECCWDIIRSISLYQNAVSINEFLEQAAKNAD